MGIDRFFATRLACRRALLTLMWGSRPLAEEVRGSRGMGTSSGMSLSLRYWPALVLISSTNFLEVGPRLDAPECMASYPVSPAADGRG